MRLGSRTIGVHFSCKKERRGPLFSLLGLANKKVLSHSIKVHTSLTETLKRPVCLAPTECSPRNTSRTKALSAEKQFDHIAVNKWKRHSISSIH